ncbi:TRAP transporter substrate-binding protein [Chitinasiproducens palmae]|uniref:Tripartite ATP-independent transporter solute receptor, DctP family n=1 Tax=Chitinasiproducens palmae TaxID=1770053 RepID=A0A1H2PTD8_9BURK|nr:TRAP transporter substrate-binding protein [Chitinasiproducens palmae]SDV50371.1 tripartite ATP-independent transporter solute receptor, DctP family [Chitinasiproducens palmae]
MSTAKRRDFLKTISAAAVVSAGGFTPLIARAAEFTLRLANNLPTSHPLNIRLKEMADRIKTESKGRVEVQIFPSSQLGSDTDTLSQIRSGAVDFFTLSPLILGTFVPAAQITGVGFAFKSYDQVWPALDGDLGAYVRNKIEATPLFAFEKIWDGGFRQVTTSTKAIVKPEDFQGMKLRVPPSPLWTSMFRAFGASPTSINFSETYSALQTRVVEGQENPLSIIFTAKLYEVQKFCSLTNHMWDGFWLLGNKQSFARLPKDLQDIVRRAANEAAVKQRADVRSLEGEVRQRLEAAKMQFNTVDAQPFRAKLAAGKFYDEWKKKFGPEEWAILEKYSGRLG